MTQKKGKGKKEKGQSLFQSLRLRLFYYFFSLSAFHSVLEISRCEMLRLRMYDALRLNTKGKKEKVKKRGIKQEILNCSTVEMCIKDKKTIAESDQRFLFLCLFFFAQSREIGRNERDLARYYYAVVCGFDR
jgi:hypothetical protein